MKCDPKIKNRISRVNGQVQGVLKMMEDERSCEDIVTQLSAIRTSVDRVIAMITTANLIDTIQEKHGIEVTDIEDAISLLVKSK